VKVSRKFRSSYKSKQWIKFRKFDYYFEELRESYLVIKPIFLIYFIKNSARISIEVSSTF